MENNTIHIGLDLSLNSSGIVVFDSNYHFTILTTSELLKRGHKSTSVDLIRYMKDKSDDYNESEVIKLQNGYRQFEAIYNYISKFIKPHHKIVLTCEAPPTRMANTSSHLDLIRANAIVMSHLMIKLSEYDLETHMIATSTLKKFANVKGKSTVVKQLMVDKLLEEQSEFDNQGKLDDVADAYFLVKMNLK